MHIKIQPQKMGMQAIGIVKYLYKQNEESTLGMVSYLDKQNSNIEHGQGHEKIEYFFNSLSDQIGKFEVMEALGKNHQGLRKSDPKFFMITISPSKSELEHLERRGLDKKGVLKEYVKDLMKGYALCMDRELNGSALKEEDLVWYAMYESERKFNNKDPYVIHNREYSILSRKVEKGVASETEKASYNCMLGWYVVNEEGSIEKKAILDKEDDIIREGLQKKGDHSHIHVLVHRKDKSGKVSLSPLSHQRGSENTVTRYYYHRASIGPKKAMDIAKKHLGSIDRRSVGFNKEKQEVMKSAGIEIKREKVAVGFNRKFFYQYAEESFDHKFNYKRSLKESFLVKNEQIKLNKGVHIEGKSSNKVFFKSKRSDMDLKTANAKLTSKARSNVKGALRRSLREVLGEIDPKKTIKEELGVHQIKELLSLEGLMPTMSSRVAIKTYQFSSKVLSGKITPSNFVKTTVTKVAMAPVKLVPTITRGMDLM